MKTIWLWLPGVPMLAPMAILAVFAGLMAPDALKYGTVREPVVEARLRQYEGDNQQREATLMRSVKTKNGSS